MNSFYMPMRRYTYFITTLARSYRASVVEADEETARQRVGKVFPGASITLVRSMASCLNATEVMFETL